MSADRVIHCPVCKEGSFKEYSFLGIDLDTKCLVIEYAGICDTCNFRLNYDTEFSVLPK